jgi:hypothetical protein
MALNVLFCPDSNRPQRQRPFELFEGPVDDLLLIILARHGLTGKPRVMIDQGVARIPNIFVSPLLHLIEKLPAGNIKRRVVNDEKLAAEIGKRLDVDGSPFDREPPGESASRIAAAAAQSFSAHR